MTPLALRPGWFANAPKLGGGGSGGSGGGGPGGGTLNLQFDTLLYIPPAPADTLVLQFDGFTYTPPTSL